MCLRNQKRNNMKNIYFVIFIMGLFVSMTFITNAHMTGSVVGQGNNVSVEEFEEVQDVMIKMMNSEELTDQEAQEMYTFMSKHHQVDGFYGSMFGMMGGYGENSGMMSGWRYSGWITMALLWTLLALGIITLIKWIRKDNK